LLTQQCINYIIESKEIITAFAILPTDEKLCVTGNKNGEIKLYSIKNTESPLCVSYRGHKAGITDISVRGSVQNSRHSLIATLDLEGTVSFWRIDPVGSEMDSVQGTIEEFVIGELRLQLLERTDLSSIYYLSESLPISIHIDPRDINAFMIMSGEGLFKNNRILSMDDMCRKFEFKDMLFTSPTAVAISDEGLFLLGFENGSLGIYSQNYTIPLTVWQNAADCKIVNIKWSSVYFEDIDKEQQKLNEAKGDNSMNKKDLPSRYKNNLSEFYVVDCKGNFHIWNLNKSVNKAIYVTNLGSVGGKDLENASYEISYFSINI